MAAVTVMEDMAGIQGMGTSTDNTGQHTDSNMLRMPLIKQVHMVKCKQLLNNPTIELMLWPLRQAIPHRSPPKPNLSQPPS